MLPDQPECVLVLGRRRILDPKHAARLERLATIMGREFADNALAIDANREGFRLTGFAGLPTLNRPTGQHQYLFVNGRPVRDKLLAGAVRGAYQDFLARDRHPMVALFLEAPPEMVDVNVHPAKTEVRFRDAGIVRGLIVGALRTALAAAGHRASTTVSDAALGAFRPHTGYSSPLPLGSRGGGGGGLSSIPRGLAEAAAQFMAPLDTLSARVETPIEGKRQPEPFLRRLMRNLSLAKLTWNYLIRLTCLTGDLNATAWCLKMKRRMLISRELETRSFRKTSLLTI